MSESPRCCPHCSADLIATSDGSCRQCRKPLPEDILKLLPRHPEASAPTAAPRSTGSVKVTLDLTQLLQDGAITQDEFDRLVRLSRADTKRLSFSIFTTLSVIAVAAGIIGLFPGFFEALARALFELLGSRGLHLLVVLLVGVGASRLDSGFMAAACAVSILTFVGDSGLFYTHASYFVAISEPALTIALFAALAYASFALAAGQTPQRQRLLIIFSRTCVFIVNLAFWVGSLWGCKMLDIDIPDWAFAGGWAIALIATGAWAASHDKRWVVNATAVFGSIHFYTQWFERLGATPGTLLLAGVSALGVLHALRRYNSDPQRA